MIHDAPTMSLRGNSADSAMTEATTLSFPYPLDHFLDLLFINPGQLTIAFDDGTLALDASGRIPVDAEMRSDAPGLFAAGTVRSGAAGRAAAAVGDGAVAAIAADRYLKDGAWRA